MGLLDNIIEYVMILENFLCKKFLKNQQNIMVVLWQLYEANPGIFW